MDQIGTPAPDESRSAAWVWFQAAASRPESQPRARRAIFSIQFADSPEPRYVTIVSPCTLELERPEDRPAVLLWLAKREFLLPGDSPIPLPQHSSTPLLHSSSTPSPHSPVWKTLQWPG